MKKFFQFIIIFLVITGWIFSGWPTIWQNPPFPPKIQVARANTTGQVYPTLGETILEAPWSDNTWTTPTNIYADDAATASVTAASFDSPDQTFVLKATGFNFSAIPDGSTINGVTARVNAWYANGSGSMDLCQLLDTSKAKVGTNNCSTAVPLTTTDTTIITKGSASDLWGNALTAAWVKNANFGVAIGILATAANADVYVDYVTVEIDYTPPAAVTFLGNDTDLGVNPTIAPEAATTTVDTFNLKTSSGTDTVTNATTTLATGTGTSTVAVLITNSGNTTTYCTSYNPTSDIVGLVGCNLPVTTASTTFNVRIKPLTHGSMPAPPGGTYAVTATITAITATNSTSGADTTSDTVTIDNASPNGVTSVSGTAGDAKVTLNWTTSNSGDFNTTSGSVVYRWAAASAGSEVPAEGSTPTLGSANGTATVACLVSSTASTALTRIDGTGGSADCTTAALTNSQAYTYKVFQKDTNGNYDVGVTIGTFTPQAVSLTFTIDINSVFIGTVTTPGTPIASSSVLTVNTNNSAGYNITINRASTTPTLFFNSYTISDTPNNNNWTAPGGGTATTTVGPSAVWTSGTTKGLGFRAKQTGTNSGVYHSAWWGADDTAGNALYSGISTSTAAQVFSRNNVGAAANENIVVEYKLDVLDTQPSGTYISSPITFTATVN